MRGPDFILRHLMRRGLLSWVLVRMLFAIALFLTESPPTANGGLVGLGVVVFSTLVGFFEVRRVRERVVLANLGVSLLSMLGALSLAAVFGEILLAAVLP